MRASSYPIYCGMRRVEEWRDSRRDQCEFAFPGDCKRLLNQDLGCEVPAEKTESENQSGTV
jgi:hypothetical protein